MTAGTDTSPVEEHNAKRVLFSPEPELQRGRKRRRTPVPFAIVTTTKTLSGESATFRGRTRRRATSVVGLSTLSSAFSSLNTSRTRADRSASPSRKKQFRFVPLVEQCHRPRSQSPSRSRSPTMPGIEVSERRRRRQRTRSRSRDHGTSRSFPAAAGGVEVTSPLRVVELVVDSHGSRDGEK
jgi:hypothetical protein